ncbi:lysophospholipase L1-like esterase [Paenibacillus cellulosilyticus]|uniref:Lysophospholipase L1-like esterase n=1 Tax=Paenibacillus cellulosilyticus TaxID=375489 RepID=A0A2V2Z426_9BACL|nr:rhamnogalacturonan acetylesterase [Paenibacillus cellulosilyticus]PWW05085.1 lysophospholipase L1-like esterase [Paenibacillus cellulosilyticus]QKS48637.1 rhamnogalacturonan acetylesterase [Paenibacillus cellulosilyticus]
MYSRRYSFAAQYEQAGSVPVGAASIYGEETGFGFLAWTDPANNSADRFKGYGGWLPRSGEGQAAPAFIDAKYGVELRQNGWPLRFRASVPEEGIYAVTVRIHGGDEGIASLNLYTGRRNMVRREITIAAGGVFEYRYYVHVCDYIPVVGKPARGDLSIYISAVGEIARLSEVTIEQSEAPTLFLGGDSIVGDYDTRYPYNPIISGGSWGQNMLQYFNGAAVDNQAHGGMTTNCFRDDGHWAIITGRIRPGDMFMFQFGHNDQKRRYLAPYTGYSANLRWYIQQVRSKGATPVIVTSLSRIPSQDEDGSYYDLLEEHAEACRKVGREYKVPVIDLHEHSFQRFCQMGTEKLKGYFNDAAHTNDYGAIMMAQFIASEIKRQQIEPLCHLMNDYDPAPWLPDESLRPPTQVSPTDKPERPILPTDLPELPYVDCVGIKQLAGLKEAMARGLLDPCLKYFHPEANLPRGQFLFLFFKAAQSPPKRVYQGRYCDIYKYEFDASNVQGAIDAELIDEATTPNGRFRPDDGLTGGELLSFIVRSLHEAGNRQHLNVEACERQARAWGLIWEGYERDLEVNRADCTVALVEMMKLAAAAHPTKS